MKGKVSCIISTYNEGKRVVDVVNVVKDHPLIDEVIVVNDGSADNTNKLLSRFREIILVKHPYNRGKSFAIMEGLEKASNPLVFLLDADLIGLTKKNITDIINPVRSGKADASISLRGNMRLAGWIMGFDFITGDRVFPRKILGDISKLASLKGFGLEVFINKLLIKNNCSIKIVNWFNVRSPWKYEKMHSIYQGLKNDLNMMVQIIRTVGLYGIIYQLYHMRRLSF